MGHPASLRLIPLCEFSIIAVVHKEFKMFVLNFICKHQNDFKMKICKNFENGNIITRYKSKDGNRLDRKFQKTRNNGELMFRANTDNGVIKKIVSIMIALMIRISV